jgi:hypothetical protein
LATHSIIYIDLPLIEARLPDAPQPISAMMLYRMAERTVRGERRFYYAATPPRYVQVITQGFAIGDVAAGTHYHANVSWTSWTASLSGVGLSAYKGRSVTRILLGRPLDPVTLPRRELSLLRRRLSELVRMTSEGDVTSPIQATRAAGKPSNARFNPDLLAADTLGRLLEHYSHAEKMLGMPNLRSATNSIARGAMQKEIELLCRVANGEVERARANRRALAEVEDAVERVIGLLCDRPLIAATHSPRAPKEFWRTAIGQVICACQKWLYSPYWLSYREATKILFGQDSRKAFNWINRLIDEGRLTRYEDPDEPNPQKAGRLDRREIERWAATDDGR